MTMPKVSVIIPVYNAEEYIEKTVVSLLNQTQRDIELILIDDGSTDNTGNLLKKIVSEDSRCKLIVQKNMGPGCARNAGMDVAQGKYILFLDADDIYEKELIEELYCTAESAKADITICGAKVYNARWDMLYALSSSLRFEVIPYEKTEFAPYDINEKLFQLTGGYVWNKLFRASFIRGIPAKFPESYCYEDMAMLFTALIKADKIAVTYKELITYRIRKGSSLSDNRDRYWREFVQTVAGIRDYLERESVYELYKQSYLNKVLDSASHLFKEYLTEEAFLGLYGYVKNYLLEEFEKYDEKYFYNINSYNVLKCLENTDSPISFALSLFHIKLQGTEGKQQARYWGLPYLEVIKGSNIVLWGAGDVGRDFYIQSRYSGWCNIVAWVDTTPEKYQYRGYPVEKKSVIAEREFDKIIICIRDEDTANNVLKEIVNMGISPEQVVVFSKVIEKDDLILKGKEDKTLCQ